MFKTSEGSLDRIIRVALGVILVGVFIAYQGTTLGWVALVVGVVALFTGVTGWCAIYSVLGISTCKMKT